MLAKLPASPAKATFATYQRSTKTILLSTARLPGLLLLLVFDNFFWYRLLLNKAAAIRLHYQCSLFVLIIAGRHDILSSSTHSIDMGERNETGIFSKASIRPVSLMPCHTIIMSIMPLPLMDLVYTNQGTKQPHNSTATLCSSLSFSNSLSSWIKEQFFSLVII